MTLGKFARGNFTRASLSVALSLVCGVFAALCIVVAAERAQAQAAPDYQALLAAPDRSDADRAADKRRDPLPFLLFAGPRPGMKVLDMGAGGGYSTELMARAVAPNGKVYGQFPADGFQKAIDNFNARLKTPAMSDAAADFRPFDDPIPPDVSNLDLITFLFYYHDTTYMNVDRAQMDRKMFAALKPGGYLVLADHAAAAGADVSVGKSLHRIDETIVRKELEAAGFKFVAAGDFWRVPGDTRDFSSNRPPSPVDSFVLKFQKPM
jgi:predicted methyltransferase